MVCNGSATHPSNFARLWCSKFQQSTRKIFLGKLKCVAQAHTTGRLTCSTASAKSSTSVIAPCFFFRPHCSQIFPTRAKSPTPCAHLFHSSSQWRPNPPHAFLATSTPLALANPPTNKPRCEAEVRCPGPRLESLCQVQHQGHCSLIFISCSFCVPLHRHQGLPHCSLSSSISAICSVLIDAVLLLPLRHF